MVKKVGSNNPCDFNRDTHKMSTKKEAELGESLGEKIENVEIKNKHFTEGMAVESDKKLFERSISTTSIDSGVFLEDDKSDFDFKYAWIALEESKAGLQEDEYDHAFKSLKSLECLANSEVKINQLLYSDKIPLEKSIQFAKLTKGLNVDPTRSTPDSIVRACKTYVEQFIQLFKNEGVDKPELFKQYFKVGSLCFGSRSRAASDFFIDQWRKDYLLGSLCKGNFTSLPEPPEPESLYTRYTSQSTVKDILFDEMRILREILTQQEGFSPAEDFITPLQFKKFLESKEGMIGFRGVNGEVNQSSIDNFIESESYLFE